MTIIAGHPFLTDFQTTKLLNSLSQKTNLKITHLKSQQVYIFSKDLAEHDYKKALDLLNHGDEIALNQNQASQHDNEEGCKSSSAHVLVRLALGQVKRRIFLTIVR